MIGTGEGMLHYARINYYTQSDLETVSIIQSLAWGISSMVSNRLYVKQRTQTNKKRQIQQKSLRPDHIFQVINLFTSDRETSQKKVHHLYNLTPHPDPINTTACATDSHNPRSSVRIQSGHSKYQTPGPTDESACRSCGSSSSPCGGANRGLQ